MFNEGYFKANFIDKMILFVKHIDIEGPETLGPVFESHGFECKTIDLSLGDSLPKNFSDLEVVVPLGGPMNVYEEDKYPFLKEEDVFIKKILKDEIPFLGICLGSQLLSKASGGKVAKSRAQEIGWYQIDLTEKGKKDPIFAGLGEKFEVFQWHGDTFSIPQNGSWLAKAPICSHQVLKVGPCAYGFQFHMEITDKSIRQWSDEYFKNDPKFLRRQKEAMLKGYERRKDRFHKTAEQLFSNFAQEILSKKVLK